jgi:hypothetical protein
MEVVLDTWLGGPITHTGTVFPSVATLLLTLDPDLSPTILLW